MKNTEKIIALYKYIAQLCALKYRVVTDVDKQYWTRYLKDIPDAPEYISIYYRDRVEEEAGDDTVLLSVRKPDFQRCPEPHDVISEWLEPGWDHFANEVKIKNSISKNAEDSGNKEDDDEKFSDSKQRIPVFYSWKARRDVWVEKQRVIDKIRKFFAQLFELYTTLERESETLEMMVGNGIIKENGNNSIKHPILLKPVKLQFDAEQNVISIHDTDTEPELYTLLFQEMREINHSAVKQLQENLRENFYHPLDRNDSPDFLKILTHRLCPDSHFIADEHENINSSDKIITTLDPVFFARKRIDGTLKAIEGIIKAIEDTGRVPGHLIDLVEGGLVELPENADEPTIEDQLAAISGESMSILLSKEANREQLEIAERIEHYNAVLVQGPPGTGKTHTIANLLGHFLAQGKSVLVTSHTKKALSVLKEKLPDEIKNLCVSVLDDTNLDMVRSIDGITEYMSRHTANELKRRDETESRQRESIMQRLADVRKKIFLIKNKEFEPIVYNGKSYSPAEAAAFVNDNTAELSYIPGKVKLSHPLPIAVEQLKILYHSNKGITESEETELICSIPAADDLLSPSSFEKDLLSNEKCQLRINEISKELNLNIAINLDKKSINRNGGTGATFLVLNPTAESLEQLSEYVDTFNNIDGWMIHAAVDGNKGGGYRQRWDRLINAIEDTVAYADSIVADMLGLNIEIMPEIISEQLSSHLQKIIELFKRKRRLQNLICS